MGNEPAAVRPGYREILLGLQGAQKSAARSAPAYSRFVNRRLGRLLAAWAYRQGLTPNHVTAISAALTFGALGLLATLPQSGTTAVAVTVLLVLGYAFDSADGQVARLRGGGSPAGEWLDHIVDCVKTSLLPLSVLISFYRAGSMPETWLLVPLAAAVISATHFFAMILTEQLRRRRASGAATGNPVSTLWRSLLVLPTDYGLLCLSFLLLGAPRLFAIAFTALTAVTALYTLLAAVKWYRELREPLPASGM